MGELKNVTGDKPFCDDASSTYPISSAAYLAFELVTK
jgi:hypothetical protein